MKPLNPIAWRARQSPPLTVRVVTASNKVLASQTFRRAPSVDEVIAQLRDRSRSGEIVVYSSGVGL